MYTVLLPLLLGQTDCSPPASESAEPAPIELDLDGDRIVDRASVRHAAKTEDGLFAPAEVEITFSRAPRTVRHEISAAGWGTAVGELGVPRAPETEPLFSSIERRLLGRVCAGADPSLARLLLQRRGRDVALPLVWSEGPPRLPTSYVLRNGGSWIAYDARFHVEFWARRPTEWVEHVERGDQVLLTTRANASCVALRGRRGAQSASLSDHSLADVHR